MISAASGMRLGWVVSFTSHAITNCLLSNHSTWKWLLLWRGYGQFLFFYILACIHTETLTWVFLFQREL
jgi:hypothetical protein